jgi:hypothetical protein
VGKSPRQWALPEYSARQRQDGPDSGQQALPSVKALDYWSGFYFIFSNDTWWVWREKRAF